MSSTAIGTTSCIRNRSRNSRAGPNRLFALGKTLYYKLYFSDFGYKSLENTWTDTAAGFSDPKVYVVQTNNKVIERCLLMTSDPGDLVVDPTCGSGTTAFVAEQWGRRWITIDTSRVALALARTRLMSARYRYYLLVDSAEGAAKEAELAGHRSSRSDFGCDVRHGFVYRRVPHITLKSIAQHQRITTSSSRQEIERVVAADANQELLFDQPYDDPKRVRVSGRFTVESLSPHRTLDEPGSSVEDEGSFVSTILENLRSSGVQNTFRGERLMFDALEPYASEGLLHAHGTITDADGNERTVAIMIGPEHGTVSPDMVKDAAREALKGTGFDILVVCGFAFEAYASETAKEFAPFGDGFVAAEDERKMGRLRVLLTRMNPDLAMSNELLKKTGSGNLFTVFGEPDVTISPAGEEFTVEVHGVDVYDPTTGVVRPSSTDDIACWFIDTDYDGEQFFVRHAYFTGAGKPYEKLQRSLNADIDEGAWASLYSTKSRPFAPPSTGRIAVKVINHYGDEVLQVYEVGPVSQQSAQ
jgi:adenine-specific DNA-methyltransferase